MAGPTSIVVTLSFFFFLHCESFRIIFALVFLFPLHEKSPLVLTCGQIAFFRPQPLQ